VVYQNALDILATNSINFLKNIDASPCLRVTFILTEFEIVLSFSLH